MTGIDNKHIWCDGNDVITWHELFTTKTNNPLIVANWMSIVNGKICKIYVTFDPRKLIR
jgi:hypothetical protein